MGRQQVKQVSRLGALGKRFHPPVPAGAVQRFIANKFVEKLAGFDVIDRAIDAAGFLVERFDSVQIMIGGLADRIELRQRIRNRQHGLLDRWIEEVPSA